MIMQSTGFITKCMKVCYVVSTLKCAIILSVPVIICDHIQPVSEKIDYRIMRRNNRSITKILMVIMKKNFTLLEVEEASYWLQIWMESSIDVKGKKEICFSR